LTRSLDKHLDNDELDRLLSSRVTSVTESDRLADEYLEEAQRHVASCKDCNEKLQMHRDVQNAIARLSPIGRVEHGNRCPEDVDWMRVAAGLVPKARAREVLSHAAQCDYCGPLLRKAAETLSDETTGTEESTIADLKSSRLEWQRVIAGKLIDHPQGIHVRQNRVPSWKGIGFRLRPMLATGVVAVGVITVLVGLIRVRTRSAEQLLAQAYTERRTLEVRIAGAKYAPVRIERGTGESRLDKPTALLKAELLISENLRRAPDNYIWLQARARADLLDGNYESAIKSLQRALESQPDSPQLLIDLASAYFLRAQVANGAVDYGNAIESLSVALTKAPEDPIALYNRAIISERMFLYTQAVEDWEHYLRVDPRGEWADDARKQLATVKEKMKRHEQSWSEPLLTPSQIAGARADVRVQDMFDQRIEDYLNLAVSDWLPKAFPSAKQPRSDAFDLRSALNTLAETASRKHNDHWLLEAISGTHSSGWADGLRELSIAVGANAAGNADQAISHALKADRLFRQAGNVAGALRAKLELVNGLNRSEDGNLCLPTVIRGLRQVRGYSYAWIKANMLLAASTCYGLKGDPGRATEYARSASILSRRTGYEVLHLRSLYYDDGVTSPNVSSPEAWFRIKEGLQEFWDSGYPPASAFDFYSDLGFAGATLEMWHFAEAAGRETLLMASRTGDHAFEATAHHWLAQVAEMAGDVSEADAEFHRAGKAFEALGSNQSSHSAEITTEVERASLEVHRGELDLAADRLSRIASTVPEVTNAFTQMLYYLSLGELHLHKGDAKTAEKELWAAVAVSETGNASLVPETDRLIWHRETGRAYRDLLELYCTVDRDDAKAFEFLEWYRAAPLRIGANHPDIRGIDFQTPGSSLAAPALRRLPDVVPGTAVLTWVPFPSGIAVWLLDSHGLQSGWTVVTPNVLRTTISRFVRMCSDPSSDSAVLNVDARHLYDWLVRPVASKLDPSLRLIVEPDLWLTKIPFQALIDEDGGYLGDRFVVVESPGLAYSHLLRTGTRISRRHRLLAVGNPFLRNDTLQPPLPEAALEAQRIAATFAHPQVFVGERATFENVKRELPFAQVFHFAGHAVSNGHQAGMLMGSGQFGSRSSVLVGASQLHAQQLKQLRLVVLSGCETAIADYGLEDPGNLVRAFLRAGVPQVIASKWRVDSQTSVEIMDRLYLDLVSGKSAAYALADSARQVRSQAGTSHPYYWSAFSEFGY
jgi:CHAT domain-containing protein/tetratricopeptide (TPR) repeat protein